MMLKAPGLLAANSERSPPRPPRGPSPETVGSTPAEDNADTSRHTFDIVVFRNSSVSDVGTT